MSLRNLIFSKAVKLSHVGQEILDNLRDDDRDIGPLFQHLGQQIQYNIIGYPIERAATSADNMNKCPHCEDDLEIYCLQCKESSGDTSKHVKIITHWTSSESRRKLNNVRHRQHTKVLKAITAEQRIKSQAESLHNIYQYVAHYVLVCSCGEALEIIPSPEWYALYALHTEHSDIFQTPPSRALMAQIKL